MARKVLVNMDHAGNAILNVLLESLASDPGSVPSGPRIFWNSTTQTVRVSDGTSWVDVGGGAGVTDHGALTGLGDDDHTQYHTAGRADTWLGTKDTGDLAEGSNLYYTDARFDSRLATKDTDDISEGTNKFVTAADVTKLGNISVTQAVDLDQLETDIAALANGMVYKGTWDASSGSFPASADTGSFYRVSVAGTVDSITFDVGDNIVAITDGASTSTYAGNWSKHDQTDAVQSVAGKTGAVTLVKGDVGLGNVDNTSDADKPLSTAAIAANVAFDAAKTGKYSRAIGDGALTSIVVTHGLGTQNVVMQCIEEATDKVVVCDMEATSTNTCTFSFATAPTSNEFRVVIVG